MHREIFYLPCHLCDTGHLYQSAQTTLSCTLGQSPAHRVDQRLSSLSGCGQINFSSILAGDAWMAF